MSENNVQALPEGFMGLVDGYGKYATEVVISRAIPAIDGLKPSQRRILYTMHKHKITSLQKSANVCGKVLEFHPHSDASVYETALSMVDSSEYTQFPLLHGKGNFSKVYFSDKDSQPAASRYTEMCLSEKAGTYFGEMGGIPMQPTEDGHTNEPVVLPVSFPSILCTPTQGIAVGVSCNIPSFNFNDVLTLTIEYIKTGKISRVIAPDFNIGGEYILNNNALKQLMITGKAPLKLRGKWKIDGKDIVITQIPFYADINSIISKARTMNGVTSANDETGLQGMQIRISCANKSITQTILLQLLKDTPLQYVANAQIAVIIGNKPVFTGVIGVIQAWVEFRKSVLKLQYEKDLASVRNAMRAPKALVELIENQALKEKFLDAMKRSAEEAERVLREGMPHVDDDVIDYILDLKLRQFADCEGRKRQYKKLQEEEKQIITNLSDLNAVIVSQLTALNAKYKIPRKTAIVANDINLDSVSAPKSSAPVEVYPVDITIKDLFIRKNRAFGDITGTKIRCKSNDVISLLDDKGRLLRVNLASVETTASNSVGSYIPTILDIPADFKILRADVISDKAVTLLFKDGYVANLNLGEWAGVSRLSKMTAKGVAPDHIDKYFGELDTSTGLVFIQTKNNCLGIFVTDYKAKNRTARTKLGTIAPGDEIVLAVPISASEAVLLLSGDVAKYHDKCSPLSSAIKLNKEIYREIIKRAR